VDVLPGDLVEPSPSSRVAAGSSISVRRSRPAAVRADGRTIELRSQAATARALLAEADVELSPGDRLVVDGRLAPLGRGDVQLAAGHGPGSEITVEVVRGTDMRVVESGIPVVVRAAGRTVAEALAAAGIALNDEDVVRPDRGSALLNAPGVVIERAVPFTLNADGATRDVRSVANTVGDALANLGVQVNQHDYAIPGVETQLVPGLVVQLVRVEEDILVQEVSIPYSTDLQPNPNLALDSRAIVRAGEPGLKTQTIRITYEDGEEIDREVVEETVLTAPSSEIVDYGTNIVWNTLDTPTGPVRYWRKLRMYATSYSASRAGTPKSAPWYGMTRLGWQVARGVVATDPRIVPLRTHLYVPGYGPAVAADTGGGVRNYWIDLGFEDDDYEPWHQWLDVYHVEPLPDPDNIRWVLP